MARVFSQEDGNIETKPIITNRTVSYSDIDLTFSPRSTGDIFKKTDAAAVKQSVKNILLTNHGEKPFDHYYGGNLNSFLFENMEDMDDYEMRDVISAAIHNHEPRAILKGVQVNALPDNNKIEVSVKFQVINTYEEIDLNVELTRLR